MNYPDQIREQVEILRRHLGRERFDAGFVERHARYIAQLARCENKPYSVAERFMNRLVPG